MKKKINYKEQMKAIQKLEARKPFNINVKLKGEIIMNYRKENQEMKLMLNIIKLDNVVNSDNDMYIRRDAEEIRALLENQLDEEYGILFIKEKISSYPKLYKRTFKKYR